MRWMQVIILILLTSNVFAEMSKPRTVVGFKHISQTHKPNCNCVVTFRDRLVPGVIEADAERGFVKFRDMKTNTVYTIYGDVQIYPIVLEKDKFRIMDSSTINHLKRKYMLQGF